MSAYTPWLDAWGQAAYGAPPIAPRPADGPQAADWDDGWAAGETARPTQAAWDAQQLAAIGGDR